MCIAQERIRMGSILDFLSSSGSGSGGSSDTSSSSGSSGGGGIVDQGVSIVTNFLGGLLSAINIGDQVPDYPIKSKNTLQGILADMHKNFHDPTSVADAQTQLANAQAWAKDAYAKGGAVNTTYGMIYDEIAGKLQAYISAHGSGTVTTDPTTGLPITPEQPAPGIMAWVQRNPLVVAALAGGIIYVVSKRKKRR